MRASVASGAEVRLELAPGRERRILGDRELLLDLAEHDEERRLVRHERENDCRSSRRRRSFSFSFSLAAPIVGAVAPEV